MSKSSEGSRIGVGANFANAYRSLGISDSVDNYEQAIEVLEQEYALPQNSNTDEVGANLARAYSNLGLQFIDHGNYERGIEVLEKAYVLPQNPNTDGVSANLANAYNILG